MKALGDQKAYGFYLLVDYMFVSKNLVTLSVEQYNDLNTSTLDDLWYVLGYSYLMQGNDIKFSLNNKFQFPSNKTNSITILQIQYFFN